MGPAITAHVQLRAQKALFMDISLFIFNIVLVLMSLATFSHIKLSPVTTVTPLSLKQSYSSALKINS